MKCIKITKQLVEDKFLEDKEWVSNGKWGVRKIWVDTDKLPQGIVVKREIDKHFNEHFPFKKTDRKAIETSLIYNGYTSSRIFYVEGKKKIYFAIQEKYYRPLKDSLETGNKDFTLFFGDSALKMVFGDKVHAVILPIEIDFKEIRKIFK